MASPWSPTPRPRAARAARPTTPPPAPPAPSLTAPPAPPGPGDDAPSPLDDLFVAWLDSPECGAWLVRCTRTRVAPDGRLIELLMPMSEHAYALCAGLVPDLGFDLPDWPPAAVMGALPGYLDRVAEPAARRVALIELAEWWRFIGRRHDRPALVRLAARIEASGLHRIPPKGAPVGRRRAVRLRPDAEGHR